ncbi:type-1 restriction enzyme MjaXIP specificity protein [Candidatus Methanoplasma termitum]|uniref:Type-1 restriction enzyme MjaXIP specificity protein n=1 Tax=Candidatus Methanoplasma termitum TaxID=1577791 RepID=A0A0A7LGM2_9ARCH|nr:restriction endonuclease subunit S [Candidatus Methanoplasma termitum]AIZ56626.1 type-1 restriction enzyme MjaXIP specificity protein [Candidatus Methanoplasma termitum]
MDKLKDNILALESGSREKGGAVDSGIPSIGGEHLNSNGGFILSPEKLKFVSEEHYKNMKKGRIRPNDILIVKDGATTGKVSFVDSSFPFSEAAINEHIFLIRTKPQLLPKYLFYFFFSDRGQRQIMKDYRGATIGGISRGFINMDISLPSLSDQEKIIDVLDYTSMLIEKRRVQIEKLELLVKSQFIEMFGDPVTNGKGWPTKPIKGFAMVRIGPFGSLLHAEDYVENGIPLVNPSHIIDGEIVPDMKLTLPLEKYDSLSAYAMQIGDVVLGRRGEIGRCAVVDNGKYLCGTGSMFIRIEHDYLSVMLQHLISSEAMRQVLENKAVGTTMMNLNAGTIANLDVFMPPLDLQYRFADFVKQVDKSKF